MNHRLFVHALENQLVTIDFGAYYLVANHFGDHVRSVQDALDAAPARTVKDFENRIARLEAEPSRVDGLIAAANEGLRRKLLRDCWKA